MCKHPFSNTAFRGTSLAIQWLRISSPNAGGPGSIPGQGTRSHMPQLKILRATTKNEDPVRHNLDLSNQIKKIVKKKKTHTHTHRQTTSRCLLHAGQMKMVSNYKTAKTLQRDSSDFHLFIESAIHICTIDWGIEREIFPVFSFKLFKFTIAWGTVPFKSGKKKG